jgi:hypothetical protein
MMFVALNTTDETEQENQSAVNRTGTENTMAKRKTQGQ